MPQDAQTLLRPLLEQIGAVMQAGNIHSLTFNRAPDHREGDELKIEARSFFKTALSK
jgi:hypothetical protein